jgi:hypothetical protein
MLKCMQSWLASTNVFSGSVRRFAALTESGVYGWLESTHNLSDKQCMGCPPTPNLRWFAVLLLSLL